MYDQMTCLLKSFDEIFNDDFLLNADDDEIEKRFEFMRELCASQEIDFATMLDELEFRCHSYITEVAHC